MFDPASKPASPAGKDAFNTPETIGIIGVVGVVGGATSGAEQLGRVTEGSTSKNPLSFKHFNADEIVGGKAMKEYYEPIALSHLDDDEKSLWNEAKATALADGTFYIMHPVHCAIGTKRH